MYAFFATIPSPHNVILLNALNELLKGNFIVYFFGKEAKKRKHWSKYLSKANFEYRILKTHSFNINHVSDPAYFFVPLELPELQRFKSIIVGGGISPVAVSIIMKAISKKIPYILWSGAVSLKGGYPFLVPIRYIARKLIFSRAKAVVATNTLAAEHASKMGAKRTSIAYTSFDIHRFDYDRKHRGENLKILNIGRIIKRKRLKDLLRALYLIGDTYDWSLDIVGDGPEKPEIEKEIKRLSLDDRVKLLPPVSYEEVPEIYKKYNLFVLPSENEVHGFVVMEALMSSVPVIVTNEVGARDFVIPEAIYPVGDIEELKKRIEWMRNPENRNRAVRYGKELIKSKATPEKWAEVFYKILIS